MRPLAFRAAIRKSHSSREAREREVRGAREGSREAREREVRGAREGSSRRAREREVARRRVGSRVAASGVSKSRIVSFLYDIISSLQTSSHDSPRTGCSPFPRPRRWALALRPEHHPRSDQSGHVEQPACRTRCPKEPHAQRGWHLQRSLPAQSEDLRTEVWLAESLRRRAPRPTPSSHSGSSTSSWFTSCMISNLFNLFNLLFLNIFQPSQPFLQHLSLFNLSVFQHLCHSDLFIKNILKRSSGPL